MRALRKNSCFGDWKGSREKIGKGVLGDLVFLFRAVPMGNIYVYMIVGDKTLMEREIRKFEYFSRTKSIIYIRHTYLDTKKI